MAYGEKLKSRKHKRPFFLRRKSRANLLFDILNSTFLILFSLSILYPFWTTILLSFSHAEDATTLGFHLWIERWTLDAYRFAFSKYGNVGIAYLNSIFRTVVGTFLAVIVTILGAYPLSKRNLPGRTVLTFYLLVTMFFGGGLIPTYFLVRNLGLLDSRWALILPLLASGFNIIIMRNFLMTIDPALEESAYMDGAGYFRILTRIIIPLSKPVIATIALWVAVAHWNSWFDGLIYIRSESKIVLQLVLRRLLIEVDAAYATAMKRFMITREIHLPAQSTKAAVIVLTIGPIIMVYPFLQKYFIKGIFMGSLKG